MQGSIVAFFAILESAVYRLFSRKFIISFEKTIGNCHSTSESLPRYSRDLALQEPFPLQQFMTAPSPHDFGIRVYFLNSLGVNSTSVSRIGTCLSSMPVKSLICSTIFKKWYWVPYRPSLSWKSVSFGMQMPQRLKVGFPPLMSLSLLKLNCWTFFMCKYQL